MKSILTIILLLAWFVSFGQVTPSKVVRVKTTTTAFNETIPIGTIIIDALTGKTYNSLLGLASTKTIATCSLGVDIKEAGGTQVNSDWNSVSGVSQILNKPATFTPSAHNQDWSTITTGRPTTLAGYGITDGGSTTSSGSYTPTLTNITNISSNVFYRAYYTKVGNIVHVMVSGTITPTTTGYTVLQMTLPYNATTSITVAQGSGSIEVPSIPSYIVGQVTNNSTTTMVLRYIATATSVNNFLVQFDYLL